MNATLNALIDQYPENIREEYRTQLTRHWAEFQPATLSEELYLERYCFNHFQAQRVRLLGARATEKLLENPDCPEARKHHAILARHLRSLERSADAALRELRTLQADRLLNFEVNEMLDTKYQGELKAPPIYPHHRLLEKRSVRGDALTNAQRLEPYALAALGNQRQA
jgi:hypothetical protein